LAYVDVKKDILDSKVNKLVFWDTRKTWKGTRYEIQKIKNLSRADMLHWMRL